MLLRLSPTVAIGENEMNDNDIAHQAEWDGPDKTGAMWAAMTTMTEGLVRGHFNRGRGRWVMVPANSICRGRCALRRNWMNRLIW